MLNTSRSLAFAPTVVLVSLAGCGDAPPKPAPAASTTTEYAIRGVVRDVDPQTGSIKLAHEEIPGFMKAMTMEFDVADRGNLGAFDIGDTIEGTLAILKRDGVVEDSQLRGLKLVKRGEGNAAETVEAPAVPRLKIGEIVPDFAMTTQEGKPLLLSSLRGKVVVLTFVYTSCPLPEYCPAMDKRFRALSDLLRAVPARAEAVRLVSVSFDAAHDTPEVLRKHAALQGAEPPLWTYVSASPAELMKVGGPLGLAYGPVGDKFAHNLCTAVVAPDGTLARLDSGGPNKAWAPDELLPELLKLAPRSTNR